MTGMELACDICPVVVVTNVETGEGLPQHRCLSGVSPFPISLDLGSPSETTGRLDKYWSK
jgi:hypothetical protein